MALPFSPELSLAVACCRWPPDSANQQVVRSAADEVRDWERFDAIVRRNRITPLAQLALERANVRPPEPIAAALSQRAHAAARRALAMAAESIRLTGALEHAGLPVMIIKGAPLALLAYGQVGLKEAKDIDLLTSPEAAPEARLLLRDLGYDGDVLGLSARQFAAYMRSTRQVELFHASSRIAVELHWGLIEHPHLLAGIGVDSPSQRLTVPGGTLRTLADDELFSYLCVHGAIHNWGRLKWLADLGAFLAGPRVEHCERLFETAQCFGAGRAASVALMLCRRLLGLPLPERLLSSLPQGRLARALERSALTSLAYGGGAAGHDRYSAPWLRTAVAQFFLAPGAAHALAQGRLLWNRPIDRLQTPLPPRLEFLYPVLRMPLWLGRAGSRFLRSARN